MGAIYDAESLVANATEGFQAGLQAPASQTPWLPAPSSLLMNEKEWSPSRCRDRRGHLGHSKWGLSHHQVLFQVTVLHPKHHILVDHLSKSLQCTGEETDPERGRMCLVPYSKSVTLLVPELTSSDCCLGLLPFPGHLLQCYLQCPAMSLHGGASCPLETWRYH